MFGIQCAFAICKMVCRVQRELMRLPVGHQGTPEDGASALQGDSSWRMPEIARDTGMAEYPNAGSMSDDMMIDSGDRICSCQV